MNGCIYPISMTNKKTYHIYFEDKCIFKDLDQDEFDLIWGRIYRSYHTHSLSYSMVSDLPDSALVESSF